MNKKQIAFILSLIVIISLTTGIIMTIYIFLPPSGEIDNRKAIIICSANDFYGYETDEGFDGSMDSDFNAVPGNWNFFGTGMFGINETGEGIPTNEGYMYIKADSGGIIDGECFLDWSIYEPLEDFVFYNISAWIFLNSTPTIEGMGVRIGLRWLNSTDQEVRTDWSRNINTTLDQWIPINITGICNKQIGNEITDLNLTLSFEGSMMNPHDSILIDDVRIETWSSVNSTNPTNPFPPIPSHLKDSDGFPAQALQVYWILRGQGYSDDNIFLMLYYENDTNGIDIYLNDGVPNDLIGAVIDVANSSVTASRVKQELNVSSPGSFASKIEPNDQLIVFMTDHGGNKVLPDGNATFHFESDNSYINETEFYNLIKLINVQRMLINIDCCFSGNFLGKNASIGNSWYDLPNAILITSSSDTPSWYWRNNMNGDSFAGSWFFHVFWEFLKQGDTIENAFINTKSFIPFGQGLTLDLIQQPLIQDNLGIWDKWSFNGNPKL